MVAFCHELIMRQPDILCASTDILRCPDRAVWIEWTQEASVDAPALRIGVMIESAENGRTGEIRIVFENLGEEPEASPATFTFDMDGAPAVDRKHLSFTMQHASLHLHTFLETVTGSINPIWAKYWTDTQGPQKLVDKKRHLAQSLWMVPAMVFAFVLILGTNSQIDRREIRRGTLNARRMKKARARLLDHSEVRLKLLPTQLSSEVASLAGSDRRHARLHSVRGHFVKRGDKIFWRKAHFRGDCDSIRVASPIRRVGLS